MLQGMDGVTRQASQHVEYEPEWESAFNLQLKLSDILTIVQDWCATDVSVYHFLSFYISVFVAQIFENVHLIIISLPQYMLLRK